MAICTNLLLGKPFPLDFRIQLLQEGNTTFRSRLPQALVVQEEVDSQISLGDNRVVCDGETAQFPAAPSSSGSQLQLCPSRNLSAGYEHLRELAVRLQPIAAADDHTSSPCPKGRGG